jgi:hypothetical protein
MFGLAVPALSGTISLKRLIEIGVMTRMDTTPMQAPIAVESVAQRLSRAAQDGDLPPDIDHRAPARFAVSLSEGLAVHAAARAAAGGSGACTLLLVP